jgi:hypothetical protein
VALGDSLFESRVPGQEGCTMLCVEENELPRCFPNRTLMTGSTSFKFRDRHSKLWIISYTN